MNSFFKKKQLSDFQKKETSLNKSLGAWDLTQLGLAGIIGSGIFVVTGYASAEFAGPAIMICFVISAVVCILTALAYAELSTLIPTSGGAYIYAFVTFGEAVAFFAGWNNLILYTTGAAAAASGWSAYICALLESVSLPIPIYLKSSFLEGGFVNLIAISIVFVITLISAYGNQLMTKVNTSLVMAKLFAIFAFLFLAFPYFEIANWTPFSPFHTEGIITGAGYIFLAYSGFDTIATAVEECKNPQRDIPIGIIASLLISSLLYVSVSGMLTGICPYPLLGSSQPIAFSLQRHGIHFGAKLVCLGALAALTTVIFSNIFGQARILMAMSRDGLLPQSLKKIHPHHQTPQNGIFTTGALVALIAGFYPVSRLSQIMSMSTLITFGSVCICVMVLRRRYPQEKRAFQCPQVFVVASAAAMVCFYLFFKLFLKNSFAFMFSTFLGALFYSFALILRKKREQEKQ